MTLNLNISENKVIVKPDYIVDNPVHAVELMNTGSGEIIYAGIDSNGKSLIKSIVAGENIAIESSADEIIISGEVTTVDGEGLVRQTTFDLYVDATAAVLNELDSDINAVNTDLQDFKGHTHTIAQISDYVAPVIPTVPTNLSEFNNDSGFITVQDIPVVNVPTALSELTNDTGFITLAEVPSGGVTDYNDLLNKPTIPTHTSDLTNDSGFITLSEVPASGVVDYNDVLNTPDLSVYATNNSLSTLAGEVSQKAALNHSHSLSEITDYVAPTIPTALSELSNDIGFITLAQVPAIPNSTSELINDSGFITINDVPVVTVPTALSQLSNDSGFITAQDIPTIPTDINQLDDADGLLGGGGASNLNQLTDVTITTPINYDSLVYENGVWINKASQDLTTTVGDGQLLKREGTAIVGVDMPVVPDTTSQLQNDSGFIALADVPEIQIAEAQVVGLPANLNNLQNQINILSTTESSDRKYIFEGGICPVTGYQLLQQNVTNLDVVTDTVNLTNDTKLLNVFATCSPLEVERIRGGLWTFRFRANVSSIVGGRITTMRFDVYKRTEAGIETLLFTGEEKLLTSTEYTTYLIDKIQPEYTGFATTDRLIVYVYATSNNTTTVNWSYANSVNSAYMELPIGIKTAPFWTSIEGVPEWLAHENVNDFQAGHTHDYEDLTNTPVIPTTTAELINDAGFITAIDIPVIPTDNSELTNGAGFITAAEVPHSLSQLSNDMGYVTAGQLPTDTSELTNGAGYITLAEVPPIPTDINQLDDVDNLLGQGGGGGASTLVDLTDTTITTPQDSDILVYDGLGATWKNQESIEIASSVSEGQLLQVSGGSIQGVSAGTMIDKNFWQGTQAAYDLITTKDNNTIYYINV